MGRMNWWKATKLYGRLTVDYRYEHDLPDRADRWLSSVDRRQPQRRQHHRERRSFSPTQASSLSDVS